ncbi:unnamed protein product [Ixodes persulcatus]
MTCLKRYMVDINSHMHDLGNMQTSKMDAYIENMEKSTAYPEKPKCFRWSHHCAEDATKEFLDRAASTYEIFQKVIVDKHALKSLAEAYKCYDATKFTHCVTRIIDDFLRIPLNASKTGVDELRRRVTEATNTCLVPKGQCPTEAKPGKDIGQNLLKGFSDIWRSSTCLTWRSPQHSKQPSCSSAQSIFRTVTQPEMSATSCPPFAAPGTTSRP